MSMKKACIDIALRAMAQRQKAMASIKFLEKSATV